MNHTPSPNQTTNQKTQILAYLMTGKSLTVLEALLELGCYALSQRIGEMRRAGVPIQSQFIKTATGKRIKEYWLSREYIAQNAPQGA